MTFYGGDALCGFTFYLANQLPNGFWSKHCRALTRLPISPVPSNEEHALQCVIPEQEEEYERILLPDLRVIEPSTPAFDVASSLIWPVTPPCTPFLVRDEEELPNPFITDPTDGSDTPELSFSGSSEQSFLPSVLRPFTSIRDPCVEVISLINGFAMAVNMQRNPLVRSDMNLSTIVNLNHDHIYVDFAKAVAGTIPRLSCDGGYVELFEAGWRTAFVTDPHIQLTGIVYDLLDVVHYIRPRLHFPGRYEVPSPRADIIKDFVDLWAGHANDCLAEIHSLTRSRIRSTLASYLENASNLSLLKLMKTGVEERLKSRLQETQTSLQEALKKEDLGFTLGDIVNINRQNRLRFPPYLTDILESEEYQDAFQFMLEIIAYFQFAHRRFIDEVSLIIEHKYIQQFHEGLTEALLTALRPGDEDFQRRCARWISQECLC